MARKKHYQDLYAYMNGIAVGKLVRESTGQLKFTYDYDWLNWKNSRPISLSMPLTEIPYKGAVVDSYFDNLLPDSELIRERIQARFNAPSKKCFDLLSFIGGDCVGALQLLTQSTTSDVKKIQANSIDDQTIAKLLKHYQTAPLGMDREFDFRISIAGAQEKTALLYHHNKWQLPHGVTPTSHIIKLPIGHIKHSGIDLSESVENEWLCLQILAAFGLPVNQAQIIHFDDIKTLVVERFDRRWANDGSWLMRLPQEDLCQALSIPPGLKYESDGGPGIKDVMNLLVGSSVPEKDRDNFFRAQIIFWILAAIDGHAKNFSVYIEPEGRYRLTPFYDIMSAYPLIAKKQLQKQKIKMAMSLKGENKHYHWHNAQRRHFIGAAKNANYSTEKVETILDEILNKVDAVIEKISSQLPNTFPEQISQSIFDGMQFMKERLIKS